MYVPSYIPEPIEIPGNVAEERRSVCLAFVRRTAVYHYLSVLLVVGLALSPLPDIPLLWSALAVLGALLLLSSVRGIEKGQHLDLVISVALMPILVLPLGSGVRALLDQDFPIWGFGISLSCSVVYCLLSGRDHSFVGQYVLSLVVSTIVIILVEHRLEQGFLNGLIAVLSNALFLFYHVYDSAALLTRRRRGQELAAVVDLYRDILNGLTYSVRVWRHWQKHKIWSLPK